jgi:serine/threonine protein kinase
VFDTWSLTLSHDSYHSRLFPYIVDLPDSSHNPHDPPASFASSVSSIAKNNVSACDNEVNTESTAALTPTRGMGGIGGGGSCNALLLMDEDPGTPREVEVHFHMPHCSPIPPGIPEGCNESSISSSRPMPDSHAFDEDGDDDDHDDDDENDDDDTTTPHNSSTESQVPALPHLRPPPTPIRIPTWSSNSAFGRPQQKKLIRSNSLLATKVLASDVATNDLFPEVMTLSGSFRIIGSPLGKGVFADVCKVQSKTDERYYALKCQRQAFRGRKDRDMALAEVRCMLILQKDPPLSPYLLRFFKAWQEDERIHVVTELCCKDTCRQLLDKHPVLPEGVIWKLVYDVASGLAHMHARKLVHNDIKPSNILLERHESLGAICKIGDFGMTRPVDSTDDGQEGDQKYMALELLHKSKLQASADIFSLGLTIYEAASETLVVPSHGPLWRQLRNGQHPFHFGPNNNSGGDHIHQHYDRSVELQNLIRRMMHPDAIQRPAAVSIVDLVQARDAGTLYNRFLADYIGTVEDQELALDENDENDVVDRGGGEDHDNGQQNDGDNEYQTPRNMRSLCSPPPPQPGQCGGLAAPSSFLFSSPQA